MDDRWYALRSKPQKEHVLWQYALSQGYELFYPRIPVKTVNPRARKMVPYFPGYMFVHVAIQEVGVSIFQWMPHAHGLICFDNTPASMPDDLIEGIRTRVHAIVQAGGELFLQLVRGDRLTIRSGPFAGYAAIFDARLSGSQRVRVLLEMLDDRHIPVELSAAWIERQR